MILVKKNPMCNEQFTFKNIPDLISWYKESWYDDKPFFGDLDIMLINNIGEIIDRVILEYHADKKILLFLVNKSSSIGNELLKATNFKTEVKKISMRD